VRSHANSLRRTLLIAIGSAWLAIGATSGFAADSDPNSKISSADIEAALEKVGQDPNLGATKEVRTLRWNSKPDTSPRTRPAWMEWLSGLFEWIAGASRVFVWAVIALLIGMLALFVLRYARTFSGRKAGLDVEAPTHVRDLDIRPESLPDDIGATAWKQWEVGHSREALSLLYRGLLSRLVHVHAVPIRDSTTEGGCLSLAREHLPNDRHAYVARLVRCWEKFVYGGQPPLTDDVRALCEEFSSSLRAADETPQ
jgi:hypothetical protein